MPATRERLRVPTIAFYSGQQMSPEAIRDAYPNARFIARAAVPAGDGQVPEPFAGVVTDMVWGIAVELPANLPGDVITATTDDGRSLSVVLAEPLMSGDAQAVLANARYWELPPAFVNPLRAVVPPGRDED
jgi:hypothetical protein